MMYTLIIPDWVPSTLNELTRGTRHERIRLARADREMVAVYALTQSIPRACGKRLVQVLFRYPAGTRFPDVDSQFKSLLDALTACGQLLDDTPANCQLGSWAYERGEHYSTTIYLTEETRDPGC